MHTSHTALPSLAWFCLVHFQLSFVKQTETRYGPNVAKLGSIQGHEVRTLALYFEFWGYYTIRTSNIRFVIPIEQQTMIYSHLSNLLKLSQKN